MTVHHAAVCQAVWLTGIGHTRLAKSRSLTWRHWIEYEERKRLCAFLLILDVQTWASFGPDTHLTFLRLAICAPCEETIWASPSAAAWTHLIQDGMDEYDLATCVLHHLKNESMHPGITSIFAASLLLAGALSAGSSFKQTMEMPNASVDPLNKGLRERHDVVIWCWYRAFIASFGENHSLSRAHCETLYHLGIIHHANLNTQVPRIAAGEKRVGGFVVEPWQREYAQGTLKEICKNSAGAFAAVHSIKIIKVSHMQMTSKFQMADPLLQIVLEQGDAMIEPMQGWAMYLATLSL